MCPSHLLVIAVFVRQCHVFACPVIPYMVYVLDIHMHFPNLGADYMSPTGRARSPYWARSRVLFEF